MFYTGSAVTFILLSLLFFTYAYHLTLAIAVSAFVLLGLLLANKSSQPIIVSRFELNSQGLCSFDENNYYQLQANSRFSFLGCWLILQPMTTVNSMFNVKNNNPKTNFFIYRDSLSKQDFSRISKVISQLNH